MIVYLDASAMVKRYIAEAGSTDVVALLDAAQLVATAVVSRAELAAALGKAVRVGLATRDALATTFADMEQDWNDYVRLDVNEHAVARAATLAWSQQLRGYDAVHLACAQVWQESLGEAVMLATFDRDLWRAAQAIGLQPWPDTLA